MTCAIEDAGWIIRDMLVWAYASGFPKSKASLKPAWEPIVMARKPGPLRMLAVDACRIPSEGHLQWAEPRDMGYDRGTDNGPVAAEVNPAGRWPANVLLTDPIFDGGWEGVVGGTQSGIWLASTSRSDPPVRNADRRAPSTVTTTTTNGPWTCEHSARDATTASTPASTGGYSRFFLLSKADRADREPVLGGLPANVRAYRRNVHPTVKPVDLMRHLVRLVTPTRGTVLDPFLGSGTTGLAAEMEGFEWIGIEKEAEYVAIAEARLNGTQRGLGLGA
jgi:site-specific DNA-methyltransferase (adenine-specific)